MTKSHKILYFGNERLASGLGTAAPILRALIAANYEVVAVVVAQNQATASRKQRPLEVAQIAEQHSIPLLSPAKLSAAIDDIKAYGADIGVLAAYGKLVPQALIDSFNKGIVNIHPSLLPLHRGSTPIESVILEGDKQTGVSLMALTSKMDAGPIYAQETVLLSGNESKQALCDQLNNLGAAMLLAHLPAILDGSLKPVTQDENLATYDSKLDKQTAYLDTSKTADELVRQVRAHAVWPRSRCTIGGNELLITLAHANNEVTGTPGTLWLGSNQIGLHCLSGILVIDCLVPPGKKEMTAKAYLAGYKLA